MNEGVAVMVSRTVFFIMDSIVAVYRRCSTNVSVPVVRINHSETLSDSPWKLFKSLSFFYQLLYSYLVGWFVCCLVFSASRISQALLNFAASVCL